MSGPAQPQIRALLQRYPRLSAVRIFEELEEAGYSGGLTILRDYLRQVRPEFVPPPAFQRTVYLPGAIAQVDWGKTPSPVPCPDGPEEVWAFCLALGYSKYLYVGWARRIRAADFFREHRRALEALGGVPHTCVHDNLKPVVFRHTRTEVMFEPSFLAFAGLYGFAPHACTPGEAHENALVERIFLSLKQEEVWPQDFESFAQAQAAVARWVLDYNTERPHKTLHYPTPAEVRREALASTQSAP